MSHVPYRVETCAKMHYHVCGHEQQILTRTNQSRWEGLRAGWEGLRVSLEGPRASWEAPGGEREKKIIIIMKRSWYVVVP